MIKRSLGGKGESEVDEDDEIDEMELLETTSSSSAGHMGKQAAMDGLRGETKRNAYSHVAVKATFIDA